MPKNTVGGKKFKQRKGGGSERVDFIDRQPGQFPARVLRLLGNRNVLCYSNDNIVRLCHICGKMKGRVYIDVGDVVLITLRTFVAEVTPEEMKRIKNGDIVGKYHQDQFSSLKKEEGVNPRLFMKLEDSAGGILSEIGVDLKAAVDSQKLDDGFEFAKSDDEEDDTKTTVVNTASAAATTIVTSVTKPEDDTVDLDTL